MSRSPQIFAEQFWAKFSQRLKMGHAQASAWRLAIASFAKLESADRGMLEAVADDLTGGTPLSDSLERHPDYWVSDYIDIVRVGERADCLPPICVRLSEYMEHDRVRTIKFRTVVTYPLTALIIALVIVGVLLFAVVPKFEKTFNDMLGDDLLPPLTEFVISASHFVTDFWLLLELPILGGVFLIVIMFYGGPDSKIRNLVLAFLPIRYSPTEVRLVRSASILGVMLAAKCRQERAWQIIDDYCADERLSAALDTMSEGETWSRFVSDTTAGMNTDDSTKVNYQSLITGRILYLWARRSITGLPLEFMADLDRTYHEELGRKAEVITCWVEPTMIFFLAFVVGGITIALFLPMVGGPVCL